ncbi:hypothetical protein, secreted, partial [gut metagenome]
MNTKYLYIIIFVLVANISMAQGKLFEKYAEMDNVTSVYISKKMFQMMPNVETAGLNLANLKDKIESLQVLTTECKDMRAKMRNEFISSIRKEHEELMRVKDGNTRANFYVKQKGDLITEMVMIADEGDEGFSIIQL